MAIRATLRGVNEAIEDLERRINEEMRDAVKLAADLVAGDAQLTHKFTTRTGRLVASIQSGTPTGSFDAGNLECEVFADAPYASYVEEGYGRQYDYLEPAFQHVEGQFQDVADTALRDAVSKAQGWR